MFTVEADSESFVRAMLDELIKAGRKPFNERIGIHVLAWQSGFKGATGQDLVVQFGEATYDWSSDQIVFEEHKN